MFNAIARKPYPSIKRLCDMQYAMSMSKPGLWNVAIGSTEELDEDAAAAIEDPQDNPEATLQNRQKSEIVLARPEMIP